VSVASFFFGALIPLATIIATLGAAQEPTVVTVSLGTLAALSWVGARIGGGSSRRAAMRVVIGGGIAMAATIGIGRILGASGV
jgi:VIT1/CCC1 family predicted Fe2+/Mn2+ transporter